MITLVLLATMALHPTDPSMNWPEPPEEMVDFLGRRRLCLELSDYDDPNVYVERERTRLNCSSLPDEERSWRARYDSNAEVRRWLDQEPQQFRMPNIIVHFYHGPDEGDANHVEVSGVSFDVGSPFRVAVDKAAGGGRFTTFTVSFGDLPARTFTVENARLPELDLQSMKVFSSGPSPNERLLVSLRFGYLQGYCGVGDEDDRPRLNIHFNRSEMGGNYESRTNCRSSRVELQNPPGGRN
jgi:hypothetical protein